MAKPCPILMTGAGGDVGSISKTMIGPLAWWLAAQFLAPLAVFAAGLPADFTRCTGRRIKASEAFCR